MRLSLVSTAVCGTVAVSALTLPQFPKRGLDVLDGIVQDMVGDLVDLVPFLADSFTVISPEDAAASAEAAKLQGPDDSSIMDAADTKNEANSTLLAGTCTNPRVRYEWRDLTDAHKLEFVTSVKCLMNKPSAGSQFTGSKNRFEDLASVHQQMTPKIHMVAQFLPWHRYFLQIYESMLRTECGYSGPMPWWDESKDAGNFAQAPMFTDAYFGRAPLKTSDGKGTCITSGAFRNTTLHVGPGGGYTDHCLSRAIDENMTKQCNWDFVKSCNAHSKYSDMESCAEMGPHAYGHNGIGAVMSDVASAPGDPIFFMHHAFVDHNWRIWQNGNTKDRLYQINGDATKTDPKEPLTLDFVLTSMGLSPDVKVRDVMDTMGGYLCYSYNY